jgi:carbamoylphosphate synthase small subunit
MKLLLEDGTEFEGYAFGADRRVTRAPWYADLPSLASRVDGVLIGDGPGDPQDLGELVAQVRLLFKRPDFPIFGVCLGHQILCLAAGGETYKLPYGIIAARPSRCRRSAGAAASSPVRTTAMQSTSALFRATGSPGS